MADQNRTDAVAMALLDADAVTLTPQDPVTFKSGLRSPVYVDNRRLISQPRAWRVVIEAFQSRLSEEPVGPDIVAGVESAGIPHSSALAYASGLPSVFVRKEAKGHGLARRIEGGEVSGRRLALIEDMVTTGGSSLSAIEALRADGAVVELCLSIITYGFSEALAAFERAEVELAVLTSFDAVLEQGIAIGRFDPDAVATVRAWLADPHAWQPA